MNSRKFREIPRKNHQNQIENDKFQQNWQNPDLVKKKLTKNSKTFE